AEAQAQTPPAPAAPTAGAPAAPGSTPAAPPASTPAAPAPTTPAAPPPAAPAAPPPAAAPAPAPATLTATPTVAPKASSAGGGSVLGISPNTPAIAGGTNLSAKEAETLTATTSGGSSDEWKFDFHGYMRAPLRVGFGPPQPLTWPSLANPPPPYSYNPTTQM